MSGCLLNWEVMSNPAAYVQPKHFEDFDGSQFERLVFAYHARTGKWKVTRMVLPGGKRPRPRHGGVRDNETKDGESVCIQGVNRKNLIFAKAEIFQRFCNRITALRAIFALSRAPTSPVLRKNQKSVPNCDVTMLHPPKILRRTDFCGAQLYAANFALSLVLHLIDSLLGAKNAPAVLARLKKFNGYATAPALRQEPADS